MQQQKYDRVAIWLHWMVALMIFVQYATGWVWSAFERGSEPRFYLFRTHLVMGSAVLGLALARIGWRLTHRMPPLPEGMPFWQRAAAKVTHLLLYAAILVQPVLGLLTVTAFGKSLGRWPRDLHTQLANLIAIIIVLHIAAAIWHQFVQRDGLIRRMLPGRAF